ncbi:hypothetical protein PAMP_007437 [Pampus punctatissimus]
MFDSKLKQKHSDIHTDILSGFPVPSPHKKQDSSLTVTLSKAPGRIGFSLSQLERDTQRKSRAKNEKEKKRERKQRGKCRKELKSLPSGEKLSGAFNRFLSDEPLEDKSEAVSPRGFTEGQIFSARWSESTLYDRQMGRHWL